MQQAPAHDMTLRWPGRIAAVSAVLMLIVVAASAQIRAAEGVDVQVARGAHRVAASTVALLVTALLALAWRHSGLRPAAIGAFVLMLALSAVGWIAGTAPPPPAAFFNQFGGLALTALLAWLWMRAARAGDWAGLRPLAAAATVLALAQAAFGGAIAAFAPTAPPIVLMAHAACGLLAAAALAALRHPLPVACAAFAVATGIAATLPGAKALAPVLHALAAALVVAGAAVGHARSA